MSPPASKSPASTSTATSYVFFGGKGGVGKTTCAAARAVAAARSGRRVLAVSTDPAHSLGDALSVRLSHRPVRVAVGGGALTAVELDAPRAFRRWLAQHRHALGDLLEHGTWLDRHDVDALLELSIPGIDELVGVLEIVSLASQPSQRAGRPGITSANRHQMSAKAGRTAAFDLIVVDTAPTGHTLRLLASPDAVAAVAAVLDVLHHEHRTIRAHFARAVRPEAADRLIELLADQARETGTLLRDANRTAFRWVMLPEALSLAETADALDALEAAGLNVSTLVVNRVLPDGRRCRLCDDRRSEQRRIIERTAQTVAKKRKIVLVPDLEREPRGVRALADIRERGITKPRLMRTAAASRESEARPAARADRPRLDIGTLHAARLVFFLGKGGTGKTTTAAATAVALARSKPNERVLLLSMDPAHSLGDVFGRAVGDAPVAIESRLPNLLVRELDAPAMLAARREVLRTALDELVAVMGTGTLSPAGSRGFSELLELTPPGVDELFGLVSMMEADVGTDAFGVVVIDAAPTGHALRLLEMPDAAYGWVQVLIRMLLKYRRVVRPGRLAAELIELSKSIRSVRQLLRSPDLARFVVVTRAQAVPRHETERLLKHLRKLRVDVSTMVINAMTLAPGECRRCQAAASAESRQRARLARACRRAYRECAIIQTPLVAPPPRGVNALERWARQWMT